MGLFIIKALGSGFIFKKSLAAVSCLVRTLKKEVFIDGIICLFGFFLPRQIIIFGRRLGSCPLENIQLLHTSIFLQDRLSALGLSASVEHLHCLVGA